MPPDAPGKYFMARIRGRDVAAISSQHGRGRRRAGTPTSRSTARTTTAGEGARRPAARVLMRAVRRLRRRPDGRVRRPAGRGVLRLAGRTSTTARRSSTSTAGQLQRPRTRRDVEGAKAFYGAVFGWEPARHGRRRRRCGRCRATATTSRSSTRAPASACGEMGAPAGFIDVVACVGRHLGRRPAALGRDVRGRRRRRDRPKRAAELGGDGPRRAVRRAVGADERDPRPAGRDVHREPVQAREQGPPPRRRRGSISARSAVVGQPLDHRVERQAAAACRAGRSSRSW